MGEILRETPDSGEDSAIPFSIAEVLALARDRQATSASLKGSGGVAESSLGGIHPDVSISCFRISGFIHQGHDLHVSGWLCLSFHMCLEYFNPK